MSTKAKIEIGEETGIESAPVETDESGFRELFRAVKNKREAILCASREYKGRTFIDVRVWYRSDETGGLRPTAKGIPIRPDALGDFARRLAEAAARIEAKR